MHFEGAVLQESHPGGMRPPTCPGPSAGAANRDLLYLAPLRRRPGRSARGRARRCRIPHGRGPAWWRSSHPDGTAALCRRRGPPVPGAGMGRAGPDGRDHTNRRQEILHGASRARRGQVVPPAGRGGGPARGAAVGCEGKKLGGSRGGGRTQAPVSSAGPGFRGALVPWVSLP
jgi:hypothetical protein